MELKQGKHTIPKGYKNTEIGVIPEDWEVSRFTEIAELKHGFQFMEEHFSHSGIGVIKIGNLNNSAGLDLKRLTYIPSYKLNDFKRFILSKGDILMALTGATLGKVAVVDSDKLLLQNYRVGNFIPNGKTTKNYLYHISQSFLIQKTVRFLVNEAAQPNLGKADFYSIFIPLPPLPEQTAIATVLSDTDSLIQALEKKIAKKELIKKGAMQELLKAKEGWERFLMPKVCWFQEGPGVRNYQFTTSGVKLLNGTNIEKGNLLLEKTDRYISNEEAFGWYSHFLVDDGDILIACSGVSIEKFHEKVTFAESQHLPLCMNTSTMRFKIISEKLEKDFLFHFLKSDSFKDQIGGKATGSAQLNFGPSHVSMVSISLPLKQEQVNIAQILSDMDTEIELLQEKLSKYKQLKQGLMQELLTGRIRLV